MANNIVESELRMTDNATPVLKNFVSQVDKVKVSSEGAGSGMNTMGGALSQILKLSPLAVTGITALATAVSKITLATIEATKEAYNYGSQLEGLSSSIGIAVSDLDKLNQAAYLSGMTFEELSSSLTNMTRSIATATGGTGNAFLWIRQLGLDIDELKRKNPNDQFLSLAKAISEIENPTLRAKAAFEIFGRTNDKILPLIERTKTGMTGFNSVWNEAKVADIKQFETNIKLVEQTFKNLAAELVNFVIPALVKTFEFFGIGAIANAVKLQGKIDEVKGDLKDLYDKKSQMDAKGGERTYQNQYRSTEQQIKDLESQLDKLEKRLPEAQKQADILSGKISGDRPNKVENEPTQQRINAEQKMAAETIAITKGMISAKREALEIEKQNYSQLKVDENLLDRWYLARKQDIDEEQIKSSLSMYAEISKMRGNEFQAEMNALKIRELELRRQGVEEIAIAKFVMLEKGRIRANAINKEKALLSEYEEYYKGGAPSETRMLGNKTYEKNQLTNEEELRKRGLTPDSEYESNREIFWDSRKTYTSIDEYLKEEKRFIVLMDEYKRALSDYTGQKQDAYIADIRATRRWQNEMEAIHGETFDIYMNLETEGLMNLYKSIGVYQTELKEFAKEFNKEVKDLTEEEIVKFEEGLVDRGSSDLEIIAQIKMAKARKVLDSELQKWSETSQSFADQLDSIIINMSESFSSGFTDAFISFIDGTKSAEQAFREFASTFLKEMAKMILQQTILNSLKEVMSSKTSTGSGLQDFLGWVAKGIGGTGGNTGNSYSTGMTTNSFAGGFSGHAKGDVFDFSGIVNIPTKFRFAKGVGLMGEAGPEGILPLARNSKGELGVKSSGGGGIAINNNITISNSGEMSQAEQRQQARMLSDMLDAKITDNLMKYERSRGRGGI